MSGPGAAPAQDGALALTAGALLKRAREAADLSIDAVAQQLKLAPRQVKALEDGDFGALPGRTFVRGFIRNYARLLRLDPDTTLAALPGPEAALERPSLAPAARTIGEMPAAGPRRGLTARIAIPVALAAIVAVAIAYEWVRPGGDSRRAAPDRNPAPAVAVPEPAPQAPATATLPNPLAGGAAAEPAPAAAASDAASALPAATAPPPPVAPGGEELLVLTFRRTSWVEVKDARGVVLISTTLPAGTVHSVAGTPPLDVVIGNGAVVEVAFRGARVDLAPHLRQNVARFRLQ